LYKYVFIVLISVVLNSCTTINKTLIEEVSLKYPEEKPFAESKFIYVDKAKLHYCQWQVDSLQYNKPKGTILMVHGVSGSTFNWRYIAPNLAECGWNILSIDIPPFGFSGEKQKSGVSFDPLNKDSVSRADLLLKATNQILSQSDFPIIILGHSLGGRIATHMAIKKPEYVKNLILIAPAVYGTSATPKITKYWPFNNLVIKNSSKFLNNAGIVRFVMNNAFGRKVTDEEFVGNIAPFLRAGVPEACGEWTIASLDIVEPNIAKIKAETLILWSKKDRIVKNKGEKLESEIENAKYVEVSGKSHCIMETHSEIVLDSIIEFLTEE
jgi:pimeloyl-ACP methyl ester carboxylesterase